MRPLLVLTAAVCLHAGNPLTLEAVLERAAKQNPGVQLTRLRVLEREAETAARRASFGPQIETVVSAASKTANFQGIGLTIPGVDGRVGPFRTFDARPVLTQKILDFSLLASVRALRAETAAARLDVEAAREEVQASIVALYLQSFQAQSRLRAAQARVATAMALLDQVVEREKAGAASGLDVARNRQQLETERLAVVAAGQDLAILRPALEELAGGRLEGELAEPVIRSSFDETVKPVMRADVRAMDERIRAAELEVQGAKREGWPRLSAVADYGVAGAGPDRSLSTYNVGVTLQIPVWTSGRIEAGVKAAGQRLAQRREEKRRLELSVERLRAQAAAALTAQSQAAAVAAQAAGAARKVLELARLRYEGGMATSVDTVTAQGALAEAEEAEIRARYEASMAVARLAYAAGGIRAALRSE